MGGPARKPSRTGVVLDRISNLFEAHPVRAWLWIWGATLVVAGLVLLTNGFEALNARGKGVLAFAALGWAPPFVVFLRRKRRQRDEAAYDDRG